MAIKVRDYEVRLVRNKDERRQVRQLRYDVYVEEEGAAATEEQKQLREEYDEFDRYAAYMGVFHKGVLVGTYRIITREAAEKMGGFYTETEFNISKIKKVKGKIAEMSRACVRKDYRENSLVMRMLWMGLGGYIAKNKISLLFGMVSWVGTKPVESAHALSYLYYKHLAPLSLRPTVLVDQLADNIDPRLARMNILPEAFVDEELAWKQMTPMAKGYLRLGGTFGKGVFIHEEFNDYSICLVLQTKNIAAAYQKHFAGSETAFENLGLKDGIFKTLGKIMISPITVPFKVLKTLADFFLREDADDLEITEDPKPEETDGK